MLFNKTPIEGLFVCEPKVHGDSRGYFFESYHQRDFKLATGIDINFIQDNQSFSKYGTLRGLHLQKGEHAQAKFVRVLRGNVLDVAVDLRPESKTFGKHFSIELSSDNRLSFFIPRDFAHGFIVLSEYAEFLYKCDNFYCKESEDGIVYNDPDLNIDWIIPANNIIVSEKDALLKSFKQYSNTN
ncbi:MAG: dTDP-4-dehydrorhamnose 3,5-epimerase [Oligoflexia bacterium]|nr:dTDP-4-dehydrorhamnose 3,5-epimerase [Oligoflexia bacterium]